MYVYTPIFTPLLVHCFYLSTSCSITLSLTRHLSWLGPDSIEREMCYRPTPPHPRAFFPSLYMQFHAHTHTICQGRRSGYLSSIWQVDSHNDHSEFVWIIVYSSCGKNCSCSDINKQLNLVFIRFSVAWNLSTFYLFVLPSEVLRSSSFVLFINLLCCFLSKRDANL